MPDAAAPAPHMTADAFNRTASAYEWFGTWMGAKATAITADTATVRLDIRPEFLRHGGTVCGPIVMGLADVAMYAAVMGAVPDGERAVTSDLTMHFMRRPSGAALRAEARILRRGKRSIVLAADVYVEGQGESVCHLVGTYALPGK